MGQGWYGVVSEIKAPALEPNTPHPVTASAWFVETGTGQTLT